MQAHDLAPTTSTTAALAIGDALAVALLEEKGFRREDFARLHPGGSLGRKLLAFTRTQLPDEICLRCARDNEKAWRWYEREGFVFEKEQVEPMNGLAMKYYRWKESSR